jgi:hypothetical protein
LGKIAVGKSSPNSSTLAESLTAQSLQVAGSSSSSNKGKGKARTDSKDFSRKKALFGVAAFANTLADSYVGLCTPTRADRSSNEAGPSTVRVDVPAPSIHEGVVFRPLAEPTPLQVELREMVAGRNPLNEAKKA